jgi:hypothetical protein
VKTSWQLRALLCLGLVLSLTTSAFAEKPIAKKMSFAERKGELVASTTFTGLFDREAYLALSSGFPTTVVIRTYVYEKSMELPVSIQVVSLRVVYDLWDEVYLARVDGPKGRENLRFDSRLEVLRLVTQLHRFSVASLKEVRVGPHYFLALVAELNPVNKKRLAEMRRWLTKSSSETRLDSSSSFFGSFVSVFVNPKLQNADRIVRLRSQPFYRVKR